MPRPALFFTEGGGSGTSVNTTTTIEIVPTKSVREDHDYRELVFRPGEDDYAALKEDVLKDGILLPLVVNQKRVLIDGYTRLQIAKEIGLKEVPVETRNFADALEEQLFIVKMNLRRHLNTAQKGLLALKIAPLERELAKRRLEEAGKKFHRGSPKGTQPVGEPLSDYGEALAKAAKRVGTSVETVRQTAKILMAIDSENQSLKEEARPKLSSETRRMTEERWKNAIAGEVSVKSVFRFVEQEDQSRDPVPAPRYHAPRRPEPISKFVDTIQFGHCLNGMQKLPSASVDLIMTSPPYADSRMRTYGGIPPDDYVARFLPIAEQLLRVLKPTGSFVLNIKEKVADGERSTYVYQLVIALREQGWKWLDDYVWCKKNPMPGKWPNRLRDQWEHCYHFAKSARPQFYSSAVREPIGKWVNSRLKKLGEKDTFRAESRTKSGFGRNIARWKGQETVSPANVLYIAAETGNKRHSAPFPLALPGWFIRLLSRDGDLVLDPFMGSGTTAVAALALKRHYLGFETHRPHYDDSLRRVQQARDKFEKDGPPSILFAPVYRTNPEDVNDK